MTLLTLTLTLLFFHSAGLVAGQIYDVSNSITAVTGILDTTPNSSFLGNYYNYWNVDAGSSTWDLTRSARMAVTSPKTIPMLGMRKTAIIEPNRTAYIIVDMQNFFLHPQLSPNATRGRLAVGPTLDMIHAFRKNAMKILWVNWGIDAYDLLTSLRRFSIRLLRIIRLRLAFARIWACFKMVEWRLQWVANCVVDRGMRDRMVHCIRKW